ncbi:hypothetical protein ARMSODRAFT_978383 [Armillaria solidipes]|uniref:Uncharacterized protein n=1 Tax=Armillaria solidipes TaxID=1076256 RepID=A0A2H3BDZ9_9AGAR|nr:hypothetical protein ARMSODRAFT_978383 [Armillaria solidipes]
MNDTGTRTMRVRQEDVAAMMAQRGRETTDLHLSLATAFYTPSRASSVIRNYGDKQLTTPVHLHRHDTSSPNASYKGSVRENVASPLPLTLGKPCHCHVSLRSQTESDITTVVHPLLRPSREEMLMELDFAHTLSSLSQHVGLGGTRNDFQAGVSEGKDTVHGSSCDRKRHMGTSCRVGHAGRAVGILIMVQKLDIHLKVRVHLVPTVTIIRSVVSSNIEAIPRARQRPDLSILQRKEERKIPMLQSQSQQYQVHGATLSACSESTVFSYTMGGVRSWEERK